MNYRSFRRALVPDLREQVRLATARAILSAAEEVFSSDGVHGAHMGEIAKRAGLAVGTLYNHFRDRDTLLLALIRTQSDDLFSAMDTVLEKKLPFTEQLKQLLAAILAHLETHRRFFRILIMTDGGDYKAKLLGKSGPPDVMNEMLRRVDQVIRRGIREKILRADVEQQFSLFLLGMIRALCMYDAKNPREEALGDVDQLVRFFLNGAAA